MGQTVLTDGASLVTMGALHAGVDLYVGYPITPASGIYTEMIRHGVGISAPDEITALQYLIGGSLNGHKAMTATSGPGFLLMAEGIGAALMMEVPLTVVLVQRLGPATGSATWNAQGDVLLARGVVSGGFVVPVLCPSTIEECAELTVHAVNAAELLRTPVILLTEKDMVVGKRTFDLAGIHLPEARTREHYRGDPSQYTPYGNWNEREVPPFRPLGDPEVQIRVTASTHNEAGAISGLSDPVVRNLERLLVAKNLDLFPAARVDLDQGAEVAVLSYGFTDYAATEAVAGCRAEGLKVSHIAVRTLLPVKVDELRQALNGIRRLVVAEENLTNQYLTVLKGEDLFKGTSVEDVVGVQSMGRPIAPAKLREALGG